MPGGWLFFHVHVDHESIVEFPEEKYEVFVLKYEEVLALREHPHILDKCFAVQTALQARFCPSIKDGAFPLVPYSSTEGSVASDSSDPTVKMEAEANDNESQMVEAPSISSSEGQRWWVSDVAVTCPETASSGIDVVSITSEIVEYRVIQVPVEALSGLHPILAPVVSGNYGLDRWLVRELLHFSGELWSLCNFLYCAN